MKVLVTGAAGFIGFHTCRMLAKKGIETLGIDVVNNYYSTKIKEDRVKELEALNEFTFKKIDITEFNLIEGVCKAFKPNSIIHLAAQAGVRYSIDNPFAYVQSNLVGFSNILELSKIFSVNKLVYASTSSVYGANLNMPFSESNIADHPIQFYAATKRSNEIMAHSYSHMFKIPTIGLRFFTVYGPWGRPDMALFKFTNNILKGLPIEVYNHGVHERDFTYIDDIVDGIYGALVREIPLENSWNPVNPSPEYSSSPFEIYNLGNSNPVNLMDYIKEIEKNLGVDAKINYLPIQKGDVVKTQSDISLASEKLNYDPKIDVKEGIKRFIDWYKEYFILE